MQEITIEVDDNNHVYITCSDLGECFVGTLKYHDNYCTWMFDSNNRFDLTAQDLRAIADEIDKKNRKE